MKIIIGFSIRSLVTMFALLNCFVSKGQISNYIYALNNSQPGFAYFSRIEIATGLITNYQLASNGFSSNFSSCISNSQQKYFLCTGKVIKEFDAVSGNLVATDTLPISISSNFVHTQFNPCDSNIYGIIHNSNPPGNTFAKYNLDNGTITSISTLNPGMGFCMGCMSVIDPDSGIFAFDNGSIIGLNMTTGQILYNSPKINLPNESFGHIALKCNNHLIYGTSANTSTGNKYLATIDPYSGIVSHVSNTGWNVGVFKPAGGGDCINQLTGNYFYSGAGHLLIEINTDTGNLVTSQTINSGELFYIQHFSECSCLNLSANLLSSDTTFCEKNCINFFDLSTNNPTSWQWYFPGASPDTSTQQNPTGICYNTYGNYDVTLVACNGNGCDSLHLTNFITCFQNPVDSIYQSNDTLYSMPASSYQWYETASGIIAGAINQFYVLSQPGSYFCVVTDSVGCVASSNTITITGGLPNPSEGGAFEIHPNPNSGTFEIVWNNQLPFANCQLRITNTMGQIVFNSKLTTPNSQLTTKLPNGIYSVCITTENGIITKRIEVMK